MLHILLYGLIFGHKQQHSTNIPLAYQGQLVLANQHWQRDSFLLTQIILHGAFTMEKKTKKLDA